MTQSKSETPRLEIRNLRRVFDGRAVVDDVSLNVAAGQVTCLLGPSGCGKSTTLRMIAGVDTQNAGEIYSDGELLCGGAVRVAPERRQIGLMFQDFALFPHLSVADNVSFGLKGAGAGEKRARVKELLREVGLSRFIDSFPHELSGGEQQRVALARALAPRPRIMLMDEPFSGLDNRLRDDVRDLSLDILRQQGAAVLVVTHEPEEAMRMADEIALMRDGRIVQRGTPHEIYDHPGDKETVAFFSDVNVLTSAAQDGVAQTPLGPVAAPDMPNGDGVEIVLRPQFIALGGEDGAPAVVERVRFIGAETEVLLRLRDGGVPIKSLVSGHFATRPGDDVTVAMRRDRCFVFPAELDAAARIAAS